MYLEFYGLSEKPFNATPDPRFLYISAGHRDALAQLRYGVQERKGFVVLTGRVGTGKTTLLNALRQRVSPRTATAFVPHSTLSFDGILEYVLEDLGIAKGEVSRAQRLIALNRFLVERERAGQSTALVIDEAQNLSPATLEEVRLLSNFETATSKLLQIVLAGQPELDARLDVPELRQLLERVALRCHIAPLTDEETREYIRTRLRIAGSRDLGVFTDAALARIMEHSEGIPRRINLLCDHCLLFGYADQERSIDEHIVDQADRYLKSGARTQATAARALSPKQRLILAWALGAAAVVVTSASVAVAARIDLTFPAIAQLMRSVIDP